MIGAINGTHQTATVIGGGISGLLVAYRLDQLGYEVTLYEASSRAGGLIETRRLPQGITEAAAHSFLATEPVLTLCRELKVELSAVRPESKARFVFRDGKLRRFPLKPHEAILTFLRSYFVLSSSSTETIEEWGARHFGKAALHYGLNPVIRGIYGCGCHELNVQAAFPQWEIPRGHSFLSHRLAKKIRGKDKRRARATMVAPTHGMGDLINRLTHHLKSKLGNRFQLNSKIESIPDHPNVILTVPAGEASRLLKDTDPTLSVSLSQVRYTPLASTTWIENKDQPSPRGVGVLIPEIEKKGILGILFNSSSFPNRVLPEDRYHSYTVMMGGSSHPEVIDWSDAQIQETIRREFKEILGRDSQAVAVQIHRWKQAIPVYNEHLMESWQIAKQGWCATPGRILFGNYTGQVSIRGMIESSAALGIPLGGMT